MSIHSNCEVIRKSICDIVPLKIDENNVKKFGGWFSNYMKDCQYSPDGKLIALGYSDGKLYVFDAETGALNNTLNDSRFLEGVAFSRDGQKLVTCSLDCSMIIYSVPDFSILSRVKNPFSLLGICFSHCGNFLFSGDGKGNLKKWDINNSEVVLETQLFTHKVNRIKLSTDCKHLLTSSEADYTAKLVDSENFSVVRTFNDDNIIRVVEFHPTERIIVISGASQQVKLWNMDDGSLIHTFNSNGQVFDLHFLVPSILLSMSGDGYITSYNVDTLQEIQKVHCGCDRFNFSFNISPDKTQLVCGRCEGMFFKVYSIVSECDSSQKPKLIELSKESGYVISNLISMNFDLDIIRNLVAGGICINANEICAVLDTCWDLVDFNENNGGNMYSFMNEQSDESDED
eukprot:TRINITY_DN3030_c4_g9_i1.p1 TRINITY_DN3030_c4_g9~~TRINITY_DN3030_c4_g9_i1.p1  ORF type:complete len:401 (-),score=74.62 TRINITY_DN3030_c4_g9_i1:862-2064(-)